MEGITNHVTEPEIVCLDSVVETVPVHELRDVVPGSADELDERVRAYSEELPGMQRPPRPVVLH